MAHADGVSLQHGRENVTPWYRSASLAHAGQQFDSASALRSQPLAAGARMMKAAPTTAFVVT